MKLRKYIKYKAMMDKVKAYLVKKSFDDYLYDKIIHEFTHNNKSAIRYYKDTVTIRDESFVDELVNYHKQYGTEFDEFAVSEIFHYIEFYLLGRFSKYKDILFTYGNDQHGMYFEISYKEY